MSEIQAADASATIVPGAPTTPKGKPTEREFTIRERAQWQLILRRFFRHRLAVASLVVFVLVVLVSYFGAMLWKYKYNTITPDNSQAPSLAHPFGTDSLGHDQFARVLRGSQQSLKVALIVAVLSTGIGAPWGALAGFYGGRIDTIMMRFCDVILTLPLLAVAGAISGDFGGSTTAVGLILGGLGWVVNARVVRGVVLSLREQEFVEAARALGASDLRIVFRHLLPNVTGAIIVQATLDVAAAILGEAALSFLGLGVQHPDTSLGLLTNEARNAIDTRPWLFYFPGLMIIVIALSINFIGDGMRDAFDPRQTRQRR
jgi:peptide/nickel transport system permease protein